MFPHQFPVAWESAVKYIELEEPGKLVPIFSPKGWVHFFPSDSHLMVYFTTWETHGFSHQFLIAQKNAAKSTLWAPRLFFHSMILLGPKSGDFLKE